MGEGDFPPCEVAAARDGAGATITGTIRRATESLLRSPISERACVYWEVNRSLDRGEPERCEGIDFWLEDASGRALVRAERIEVAARARRKTDAIAIVDADVRDVSRRLAEIKRQRKQVGGAAAAALHAEREQLKDVATLLCAVAAHARGRVHTGGSLRAQEAFIRSRTPGVGTGEPGQRTLSLLNERFEVVLAEGAQVQVSGLCLIERIPPGLGLGGGYRDVPTCLHMRAPAGGHLYIRGLGEAAPQVVSRDSATRGTGPRRGGLLRRLLGWFR